MPDPMQRYGYDPQRVAAIEAELRAELADATEREYAKLKAGVTRLVRDCFGPPTDPASTSAGGVISASMAHPTPSDAL